MRTHLYQSEKITDTELAEKIDMLPQVITEALKYDLKTQILLTACQKLTERIESGKESILYEALEEIGQTKEQSEGIIKSICSFTHKDNFLQRIKADFGTYHPFDFNRNAYDFPIFEAWKPMGVQVHIIPGNAVSVSVLSVLEGLMAGNINIVKNTSRNGRFAVEFMQRLIECDATGILKHFIYIFELSSSETEIIQKIISQADVVCIWGGEEAVKSVKEMIPSGVRTVVWGHKISFAYVTESKFDDPEIWERIAEDICRRNQQACTSPQCVLVETISHEKLDELGIKLADALKKVSSKFPYLEPRIQEQAEITTVKHLHRAEISQNHGSIIESPDFDYSVLVDYRPGLQPSPLFRTVWLKPIERNKIIETLRPFNIYLQTCGLAVDNLQEAHNVTESLVKAGIERVTKVGEQHNSYIGEPHDGVYALQRYTKKVGIRFEESIVKNLPNFIYLEKPLNTQADKEKSPIMTKENRLEEENKEAKIYLKSGGSTGVAKINGYSWQDWDEQIKVMAENFFIGGLSPKDRCAILFSAGNMYGGFISTQKALERINATSITLSSNVDTKSIAEAIVLTNANVILGMPSFLRKLFREEYDTLKKFKGFEKLFYGGELMTMEQQKWFKDEFGFKIIHSPVYASNDAMMNGYACEYCSNGEFHVPTKAINLEIVKMDSDEPVEPGEVGRVIITKKSIKDPVLRRYEIGDLAKWIPEQCSCGHQTPKFKLMGRHGDLVRCGAKFINYREICQYIIKEFNYTDDIQMVINTSNTEADEIKIRLLNSAAGKEKEIRNGLLNYIKDLRYSVESKNATLEIETTDISGFEIATTSGKVRPIIDTRINNL